MTSYAGFTLDECAERVEANIAQVEENLIQIEAGCGAVEANLALIDSEPHRFIRNRRLKKASGWILHANGRLLHANRMMEIENWGLLIRIQQL